MESDGNEFLAMYLTSSPNFFMDHREDKTPHPNYLIARFLALAPPIILLRIFG
jgi:hypothetical protein